MTIYSEHNHSITVSRVHPSPERDQAQRDTLSLATSSDFHVFPFAKRRVSHYCRNVGVEQTDIVVDMGLLKPQWRSISIEGGDLDSILKVLKSEVKAESGDDVLASQPYFSSCACALGRGGVM